MSVLGLALIIGSALGYSFADLFRKRLVSQVPSWLLLTALSLGMLPIFLVWWWVGDGAGMPSAAYWPPAIASGVLNLAANLFFLRAMRLSPLSVTIPMLSLTPVFTAGVAVRLLGEVPTVEQFAGIGLVVVGVFMLGASERPGAITSIFRRLLSERGALLMIGVSLLWALTAPLDKVAMRAAPPSFHGVILNALIGFGALAVAWARGETSQASRLRRNWPDLLGSVVATVVGLALQLVALGFVWAAWVETLKRAIGSFLALIWGRLFFQEGLGARKFAAVGLMGLGLVLMLW